MTEGMGLGVDVLGPEAHHTDVQLNNVEIKFLPPNKAAAIGPGLKIYLLGAIPMLSASWDNVKRSTIVNCFQHARFVGRTEEASEEATEEAGLEEEYQLEETWSTFECFVGAEPQSLCIEDFVGSDNSAGTTAELMDGEIAAEATAEQLNEDAAKVEPASADISPLPTSTEAVAALALVCRYCSAIESTGLSLADRLDYVENAVVKHAVANKKQATLLQYLQPNE